MHSLFSAFIPIWLLTALGYAAARGNLLGPEAGDLLGRFTFRLAMPASLFGTLSTTNLHALANASILAFGASTAATCLAGLAVARRRYHRKLADQAIGGMLSGYVNSANLGIPVAVAILGDGSFVAAVILFQTLVVTPVILTLMDIGTGSTERLRVRDIALMPVRNPIIVASALGLLDSATHVRMPDALLRSASLLGGAAVPAALIALGMSLYRAKGADAEAVTSGPVPHGELAAVVVLKTLVQPALAYVLGRFAFHLTSHQLLAAVLCAALPTAQNAFIYAREYGVSTTLSRNAIVSSTLVSMGTLSLIVWLLT